jgi:hypothetical protein
MRDMSFRLFVAPFPIVVLTLLVAFTFPCFASQDVKVDVEVEEVEPGTEPPEPQTPAGEAEPGSFSMYAPKGPFEWISQHPLTLMFLQFPAESAYILKPGVNRVGYRIDFANSMFVEQSGTGLVQIDLEGFRQTLSYRRALNDRIELAAFLPLQSNTSGFMDSWIQNWHDFFGLPTGDRPNFAKNQYSFVVAEDNSFKILGDSGNFGIGDISLTGKYFIRPEDARLPALSARAGIKLPTGDSGNQLGSGGFGFGIDLLAQKAYGRLILYGQTGYIFTGSSDFDLDTHDLFEWSLAGEFQTSRKHSWIVQVHKITNPFYTSVQDIDSDTFEMALGWKRIIGRNLIWEGGFSEDVVVDSGPDFAAFTQFSYTF